jgi:A/G-specific adenine glycosylase
MDLGATLCTRSKPDCGRCPLQDRCVAYATGRTAELPVRKPKKATPEKRAQMLVVIDRGQVLLEQRPGSGIWGGLLSLPEVDGHVALNEDAEELDIGAAAESAEKFGAVAETEALLPLEHGFTHYKLYIHPYRIALASRGEISSSYVWWDLARIDEAALPSPIKKLLGQLGQPSLFG